MYCAEEVQTNSAAGSDTSPLTDEENAEIAKIRSELTGNFCRRCNYCAPCTVGISIPNVFLFAGYLERYGLADWAKGRYKTLPRKSKRMYRLRQMRTPLSLRTADKKHA